MITEWWKWLGDNGVQVSILVGIAAIFLTIYLSTKNSIKLKLNIREELGGHIKELLELDISTRKFLNLDADTITRNFSLTEYRPNLYYLQHENANKNEIVELLIQLRNRCKGTASKMRSGHTIEEWKAYVTITLRDIDKAIGHINRKLW